MPRRKEFSSYTKILRDHNIQYRWGFPVKLIIFKDGAHVLCQDPAAARNALQQWNILSILKMQKLFLNLIWNNSKP